MSMSRRAFIGAGLVLASAAMAPRGALAQPRKPTITVYRDPT